MTRRLLAAAPLAIVVALAHAQPVGHVAERISDWRPPGQPPLPDMVAAERVRSAPETQPENREANRYTPSAAELEAFHAARYESGPQAGRAGGDVIPQQRHVTGAFTGTTDELLQWSAHKWGIPEDLLRAVAHQESTWRQGAVGDRARVEDPAAYPDPARASDTEVFESMGMMQIKWRPDRSLNPGTEPLRWKSTPFNVDYYGAIVRFYYDGGAGTWFGDGSGYMPGQRWLSVGAWFQPTPWRNPHQLAYIESVQHILATRAWTGDARGGPPAGAGGRAPAARR